MRRRMLFSLCAMLLLSALLPGAALAAETGRTVRVGWVLRERISEAHDGVYSGYIYDYLMEIAKTTGWTYEFVVGDASAVTGMLARGEIDLAGNLLYSDERSSIFDYAELPSGNKYRILFTAEGSPLQTYDFASFDGACVGVLRADASAEPELLRFAERSGFACTTRVFDDEASFAAAIGGGQVDAGVVDGYYPQEGYRVLAEFRPVPFYFATTKGNGDILHGLNQALYLINSERPNFERELYDKHLGVHYGTELTAEERAAVEASKTVPVTVGVIDNSAPICYWNEETLAYEGITIDTLHAVSEKTGLTFQFTPVDVSRRAEAKNPTADSPRLVAGVTYCENLPDGRGWLLSDGVHTDTLTAVGLRGADLTNKRPGKTVALLAEFGMAEEYARLFMPEYEIVRYKTPSECLDAVAGGRADAAIYMRSCISYLLQKPKYEKLEIIPAYSESIDVCVAGFTEEAGTLISIINKGLHLVTEGESRDIALNYTVMHPYRLTAEDVLYKYRAPLCVLLLLFLTVIAALALVSSVREKSARRISEALVLAERASAAKGNFMSRMSHEIRTPLNAVIGYNTIARSEMTEKKTDAERRQAEMKVMDCLTKSDIASRHLLTIINDVLDMSAIESGKIKVVSERFDFKGLVSSLTAVFYAQAKARGVEFDVQFDTHMEEWVVGDQMRVNQVLTNLLSNAIKFTPDGGRVTLFIRPETEEKNIRVHFEVRDTGIGIAEEYMPRLFTPFEQADASISRRFGGTGLGLSITKTLVDMMGGTIGVVSKLGEGSTFTVELSFGRTEQPEETGPYDFSGINALIVDDDGSTCDYIRLLLTRSGVRSTAVTSGEDALIAVASAMEEGTPYTVCLVDWRMPKMDGLETVKRIRDIAGDEIPIIVITAYDFSEVAEQAAEIGVNMFISKPLFQSSLFNMLANISGSPTPKKTEKLSAYRFSGERVLLAEDNLMNMEIARKILSSAGLTVESAWNGQEAVELFTGAPAGTYRAILMDVQMPVMDGYQATRAIRESKHPEAKSIPIIAMTADAFAENVAESHAAGMNDHISKPIDVPTLFQTLKSYIERDAAGA